MATFTRQIDSLGRLNIPKKFFKELAFELSQECEITIEYGCICVKAFDNQEIEKRANVGIVRHLDKLNRISVPKEYIKVLNIKEDTILKVFLAGNVIKVTT